MGVEVVWVRLYTSYLGTVVYAFAAILGIYLVATYVGSQIYRMRRAVGGLSGLWLALLGLERFKVWRFEHYEAAMLGGLFSLLGVLVILLEH